MPAMISTVISRALLTGFSTSLVTKSSMSFTVCEVGILPGTWEQDRHHQDALMQRTTASHCTDMLCREAAHQHMYM
jgi:hypothetical protein